MFPKDNPQEHTSKEFVACSQHPEFSHTKFKVLYEQLFSKAYRIFIFFIFIGFLHPLIFHGLFSKKIKLN